ncbi:MAG: RNA methyltransferase [Promethearchaeota archaeon]
MFRDLTSFQGTRIKNEYKDWSFTILLIKPETIGNIGSIARLMKNFGFNKLILINPLVEREKIRGHETQGYAMHGKDILLSSKILKFKDPNCFILNLKNFLKDFDLIIGTTASGTRYTNLRRLAIFPHDLKLPSSLYPLKVAILFGRESRGLTNEEIELADIILRIPTSNEYPALNLSQACGIILYEIFKKIHVLEIGRGKKPVLLATREDRDKLYTFIKKVIELLKIRTHKKENVLFAFKNMMERAFISKKEASLMFGLFSKIKKIIEKIHPYE